ncbi:zinc finger protein [Rutstroemia sp. NJR-2017a WRK4]|nr:zinc finger protein [Rutstroemia sp. NJR-2017a WRK4]
MASTAGTTIAPDATSEAPSRPRNDGQRGYRGRGRGRGRGGHAGENGADFRHSDHRGGRRGRGGHRGGLSNHELSQSSTKPTTEATTKFAAQKKLQPTTEPGSGKDVGGEDNEEEDEEVCFICAASIEHNAVAPCNHRTCHICALRMRALYKTKDCPHCRTSAPFVIFTDDATKRYEDYSDEEITNTDPNIGIRYESNDIQEDTLLLLRYNCPDPTCDTACRGWPDLHRHVRSIHHKKMCDLCTRHKKVFTHEHELFADRELERHMKKGDDNPGAVDQTGFKGHPLCTFCGQRFYGDDELFVHCREKHERCHVCDRLSNNGQPHYYVDWNSLSQHFRKDHFPCTDPECLEQKFVVFPTEMDLKAHQLEVHGSTLSKDVRRDARMVDISTFEYRQPYSQERSRGGNQREQREGRGRGRGRDPNAEPLPVSSAQPLRRDEQAFHRQMAVQSAQAGSTRAFGGQLTAPTPAQASSRNNGAEPSRAATARPAANVPGLAEAVAGLNVGSADLTPAEQVRQLKHRDVIERVTIMLQGDQTKITQFRNSISSYKNGSITANALIDSFFALFSDTTPNALGTLIREIADLYEDKKKADAILAAWNDWRAINEDYPSLPAPSSSNGNPLPLGWASLNSNSSSGPTQSARSNRVLKLKSSTAQSSRSSVSQNRSWGSASSSNAPSSSTSSSAQAFPGLPSTRGNNTNSRITTTPWVAPASAPSSSAASPSISSNRVITRAPPRKGAASSDAFPALPPAAKPQSTIFGYGTGMVRRDLGGGKTTTSNAWSAGSAGEGSSGGAGSAEGENVEGGGKKGKGKGKKQVLMNWG